MMGPAVQLSTDITKVRILDCKFSIPVQHEYFGFVFRIISVGISDFLKDILT
jgi:hypothetical protein